MMPGETILSGAPVNPNVSPFKVMQSAAGFYIGTSEWDNDFKCDMPYSRESGYYPTQEAAQQALDTGDVSWR